MPSLHNSIENARLALAHAEARRDELNALIAIAEHESPIGLAPREMDEEMDEVVNTIIYLREMIADLG
jgi:hypothetical protein